MINDIDCSSCYLTMIGSTQALRRWRLKGSGKRYHLLSRPHVYIDLVGNSLQRGLHKYSRFRFYLNRISLDYMHDRMQHHMQTPSGYISIPNRDNMNHKMDVYIFPLIHNVRYLFFFFPKHRTVTVDPRIMGTSLWCRGQLHNPLTQEDTPAYSLEVF